MAMLVITKLGNSWLFESMELGGLQFFNPRKQIAGAKNKNQKWLVVWKILLFFHSVGNAIIPTDFQLTFFRGVG